MAAYHLHARLFEGSLAAPERNELQSQESDSWTQIERFAHVLARKGFAVWIYEHCATAMVADGYRVVAEWNDRGERVR